MLNLALMTLSASSLERRITLMQRSRKISEGLGLASGVAISLLIALACSSNPPVRSEALPRTTASSDDSDAHLQEAATRYYGQLSPNGKRQLLWFVFNPDWSVQRHAIGTDDAVEVEDDDLLRAYGDRLPAGKPWSVNASLANKFPDLEGIGTRRGKANVSSFGGGIAVIGRDTVSVFWARFGS